MQVLPSFVKPRKTVFICPARLPGSMSNTGDAQYFACFYLQTLNLPDTGSIHPVSFGQAQSGPVPLGSATGASLDR
jgi:hypothetical protein